MIHRGIRLAKGKNQNLTAEHAEHAEVGIKKK
jgi:hypothetical protein